MSLVDLYFLLPFLRMLKLNLRMTGLDAENDRLLEVACIITDGSLKPLDNGVSYVIRTDKKVLDSMNEWCVNQHGKVSCSHVPSRSSGLQS